ARFVPMMQDMPVKPVNMSQRNMILGCGPLPRAAARPGRGPPAPGVTAVKQLFQRMWREEDGVLSFEWTVLTSLLTVGVVSGIASVRDAVIDEMGDLSQAMVALDQSYYIQPPLAVEVHTWGGGWGGWGNTGGWGFGGGFGGVSGAAD